MSNEKKNKKPGNVGKSAMFELIVDQQEKAKLSNPGQYIPPVPNSPKHVQDPKEFLEDVILEKTDELLLKHGFGYQNYGEQSHQKVLDDLAKKVGPIAQIKNEKGETMLAKKEDIEGMIQGLDVSNIQIVEKVGNQTITKKYAKHEGPDSNKIELQHALKKVHEVYKWLIEFFTKHPVYESEFLLFLDKLSKQEMEISTEEEVN